MKEEAIAQFTFSFAEFRTLPAAQQRFFVRLAMISDDLRHLLHLILVSASGVKMSRYVEKRLALHQLLFALRMCYGILNEAWEVIQVDWHQSQLSKSFYVSLPTEAKKALEALKRYFSRRSFTNEVRNRLAFHFTDESIDRVLKEHRVEDEEMSFVSGQDSFNIL